MDLIGIHGQCKMVLHNHPITTHHLLYFYYLLHKYIKSHSSRELQLDYCVKCFYTDRA